MSQVSCPRCTSCRPTSNDWAYQFLTLVIEGISPALLGKSSSSFTLCASRTGSSSARTKASRGFNQSLPLLLDNSPMQTTHLGESYLLAVWCQDSDSAQTAPFAAGRCRSGERKQSGSSAAITAG